MPAKAKATKAEIIKAAFDITREKGIDAVTAKELAKRLKCSTQPLYYACKSMDNVHRAVIEEAQKEYKKFLFTEVKGEHKFKSIGMNYIRFAKTQPHLFKLLFMSDRNRDTDIVDISPDGNKEEIISIMREVYPAIPEADANDFYVKIWIFCHGIATMIVTQTAKFTDEEMSRMGTEVFTCLLNRAKQA